MKSVKPNFRQLNSALSLLVILLAVYVMVTPLIPQIRFMWKDKILAEPPLVAAANNNTLVADTDIPAENTLIVPRLFMQETIQEGYSATVLSKGVWRRPNSSSPNDGSNTVFVGHRFTYSDPAVFYHLDKVKTGDKIVVYWDKTKYTYEVSRTFVVPATAVEIEAPTNEPLLTLYTCTPIWTAKDRLVVQATLKEQQ